MKHIRYVIHLKLANDSFKCDSACVSCLEFSIYFNFCRFRALAYTTLDKLSSFFIFNYNYGRPMVGIGQVIIFLPYDFYLLLSSFFFSSPNPSGRRLDVYHTSAHGVALVRI